MKFAATAHGVGKQYRLGEVRARYGSLRESLTRLTRLPFAKSSSKADAESSLLWALKDVSFEIGQGELVGIIGRNGAGKSTLLKILSRITTPTEGEVRLRGRVGSLLEVGTGFHPELTGRENIFLNGAILGMRRTEIARKFDDIVAFAEIEKFVDTPVKFYSSGMYTRLAFSVAAHLEPEILVVDEVLAVGDLSFQKKCLNKMQDVGQDGRTVLFVSHNMAAITRLCHRAILLDAGRVIADGPAHKVVGTYLNSGLGKMSIRQWDDPVRAPGNEIVRLRSVRVCSEDGETIDAADIRKPVGIEMEYEVLRGGHVLVPNFHVYNEEGACVFVAIDTDPEWHRRPKPVGQYATTAWIAGNYLSEGTLVVGAAISTMDPVVVHFFERDAVAFQIVDGTEGDSARGDYAGPMPGVVRPMLPWTTKVLPSDVGRPEETLFTKDAI